MIFLKENQDISILDPKNKQKLKQDLKIKQKQLQTQNQIAEDLTKDLRKVTVDLVIEDFNESDYDFTDNEEQKNDQNQPENGNCVDLNQKLMKNSDALECFNSKLIFNDLINA
ncbi:UNKNOWN [Stylonychia lemnae]|uniref:Uncharacterized protein n=1 Tax=Stylonychia lemnae TaxID=5949 RepID=A0A078AHT5_STYLE|nr:UNKNOWN [Stylonychia lemnae]|eukprot:CDW81062.1 UNKNOWN [Stylonychia lemnae]